MLDVDAWEGEDRCFDEDGEEEAADPKATDSAVGVVSELQADRADEVEGVCACVCGTDSFCDMEDLLIPKFDFDRADSSD